MGGIFPASTGTLGCFSPHVVILHRSMSDVANLFVEHARACPALQDLLHKPQTKPEIIPSSGYNPLLSHSLLKLYNFPESSQASYRVVNAYWNCGQKHPEKV
jgi:predicted transposase YdaD